MRVAVVFRRMSRMVVLVLSVLTDVLMVMGLGIFPVRMLMAVFVRMFMRMRVSVFVAVLHVAMAMFVRMGMRMIVSVKVLMFVLSLHGQDSLQGVEYFEKGLPYFLRSSTCPVNLCFSGSSGTYSFIISPERLIQ
jgi:hypothetical protein